MADQWPSDSDSVLRGLFGSLLNSASQGLSTADVWSALRGAAQDWATGVLSVTQGANVDQATIDAKAKDLIGSVSAADVSRYRGIAGQQIRAQQNLAKIDANSQITSQEIFVAPWSTTASNPAIPTRYRLRIQRLQSITGLSEFSKISWSTYELGTTLTSIDDVLGLADDAFNRAKYNQGWQVDQVLNYGIEAI